MKSKVKVVVVGGGVVGVSMLYHLAKKGWSDVVLVERKELTSGSTWHAAGLLPLFNMSYSVGQLHKYAVDFYKTLEKETGKSVGFSVVSNIRLAQTKERMDEYHQYAGVAKTIGVKVNFLKPEEIKKIWPLINTEGLVGAIQHSEDGYIQPADLTQAMATGARNRGAEIYRNTKNNKLKGYLIDNVTAKDVNLSSDELILLHSNFDKIEKYLFEVMTLSSLTDLDFYTISDSYFKNDNYKNFEEIHKQLTYLELDKREAKTQQEISKKQRINKIKSTFKGVQVISKSDLIGKLRKDLNYKLSNVSNEVLKKQISGIFEADYNKKTKEFTLKLVQKEGTFKSCFLYKTHKQKSEDIPLFLRGTEPKEVLLSIRSTNQE